jgi:hypothetical protein
VAVNKGTWLSVALSCLALMSAAPQENHPCQCHPREAGASGSRNDWEGYRKGGIAWHYSVDEALKIARDEKKLVFWYHVAGDLDKEGC